MNELSDTVVLKAHSERRPCEEAEVISIARRLWVEHMGVARVVVSTRVHKGLKRRSATEFEEDGTEIGFLRKRRRAVAEAAEVLDGDAKMAKPQCWSKYSTFLYNMFSFILCGAPPSPPEDVFLQLSEIFSVP